MRTSNHRVKTMVFCSKQSKNHRSKPMVDDLLIIELKQLIKKAYGQDLSFQEASEVANTLVGYFDLLAKINHEIKKDEKSKN